MYGLFHIALNSMFYLLIVKYFAFVLTIFNEGAYLTFKYFFHKAFNYFSSIVKSRSNPFLEPISTNQYG